MNFINNVYFVLSLCRGISHFFPDFPDIVYTVVGLAGPAQNFGHFSMLSKYILIFDMLAGRLELFPVLILFHPVVWKDFFSHKKKHKGRA